MSKRQVLVEPLRVKESPVHFECHVDDVVELGDKGGAGNLVICQIAMVHADEDMLNDKGIIDSKKLGLVGRMGGNYYCHASEDVIFEVEKPIANMGIGIDKLPESIRNSAILSGNDLGQLGNFESLPTASEATSIRDVPAVNDILLQYADNPEQLRTELHQLAKSELEKGNSWFAWKVLALGGLE